MNYFDAEFRKAIASDSRELELTFKAELSFHVAYLFSMERAQLISINDEDVATILTAVMHSGKWIQDSDRVVRITLKDGFEIGLVDSRIKESFSEIRAIG